jgi:hypothetical protein
MGQNPPSGAAIYYWLKSQPQGEVTLEFLDAQGKLVKKFSSQAPGPDGTPPQAPPSEEGEENPFRGGPPPRVATAAGMNRFVWNLRYADATTFPGLIMWAGSVTGPRVSPGTYQVRLTADGKSQTQSFTVQKDPRLETTPEEYARQLALALQVRDKLSETNEAVIRVREVRKQLEDYAKRDSKRVSEAAKDLIKKLTAVEENLYQTKNRASEDPLNFPIKLNNKLAYVLGLVGASDNPPTAQSYQVYEGLASAANAELKTLSALLSTDLSAFNKLVREENIPAVTLPAKAQ